MLGDDVPFITCTRSEFNSLKNDRESCYILADFAITVQTIRRLFDGEARRTIFQNISRLTRHAYGDSPFGMAMLNILYDGESIAYHACDTCDNATSVLCITAMITDDNAYDCLRICTRCIE